MEVSARPLEARCPKYSASHGQSALRPPGSAGPVELSSRSAAAYKARPAGGKTYTEDKALGDEALAQADVRPGLPCHAPSPLRVGTEHWGW